MKWRYGFYFLIFVGFAVTIFLQYNHRYRSHTVAIETSLLQGVTQINHLLKSSADAVETMRIQAEAQFRDPRVGRLPAPIRRQLSNRPEWGGFAVPGLPTGMTPDAAGNLTGIGSPNGRSAEWEREVDVALNLNPLFRAALTEIPNAVWVYYTSAREFINICPWVSDAEFHYTPDLLEHEFYVDGLPDRNPERKLFWTKAYIDLYGKGMMVTVSVPVDDDNGAFRGTVALDLTLDVLSAFSRSILGSDQPGTTMLVNASGQLLAHPWLVASSDETVKMADEILPEPLRGIGGRSTAGETPFLRASGSDLVFWKRLDRAPWTLVYHVKASVVRDQVLLQMKPEAAVFVFLLLSLFLVERHFRTSDALRESERKFRHLIEFAPIGIFLSVDFKYIYTNPAGAKIVGLSDPGEIVGKHVTAFHLEEDKQRADQRVGQLQRGDATEVPRIEFKISRVDGSIRDLDAISTTIDWGGERAILAMVRDITDLQSLERQLRHAQKMEVVGQLAGGAAHDFNNLLHVIQANLELIGFEADGNDKVWRLVTSAQEAVRRGAKLSQQLLSFSRRQALRPETLDPNDLIERTSELLKRTLGKHIEIDLCLDETAGAITVDPNGLENAILNLAFNARGAMPAGGRLTIRSAVRHLDDEVVTEEGVLPAGDYVEIAVSDTGCGMPPDVLARAFEPFYTTKVVGEGSGLGLSMVYGFTLQSSGRAELESEVGRGTTVRMIFPMTT